MNNLQQFVFSGKGVRVVLIDNEPWWCAKDVCNILELERSTKSLERLEKDEVRQTSLTDSLGRMQDSYIINESGLWNLVLRSDKPEAKVFKKWLTSEVIPQIRKTGSYSQSPPVPRTLVDALRAYANEVEQHDIAKAKLIEQAPKVELAEQCLIAVNCQSVTEVAKVLNIGRNKLFEKLRTNGHFNKRNLPYQEYIDRGYYEVKEHPIKMGEVIHNYAQTFVTAKGLDFIRKILNPSKALIKTAA